MKLSTFPFLTGDEFSQACREFIRLVDGCDRQLESLGWTKARFDETVCELISLPRLVSYTGKSVRTSETG